MQSFELLSGRDRFVVADPGIVIGERLTLASAAFAYEGRLRSALGRLKYAGAARVAAPLAAVAMPALQQVRAIAGSAPLVPVPLHPVRARQRGFNQAALLAVQLGRRSGMETSELLVRDRTTTRQHGLDRAARMRNLAGAFRVPPGVRVPPAAVLVDDILTTSATMEACAGVLRDAGCQEVYGVAIAREV